MKVAGCTTFHTFYSNIYIFKCFLTFSCKISEIFDPVWRDEVEHISHRHYSTGFFYGQPGQYTENSHYVRDWQIVAKVVECDEQGNALLTLNNKFGSGDVLELVGPDVRPQTLTVGELVDAESGEVLPEVKRPQMLFKMKLPCQVPPLSLLRRQADGL